jgi:hypothetical protein
MKLKKAAHATAICGFRTRVETMVAMEFAASCSPFRKSNSSAMPINPTSRGNAICAISILPAPAESDVFDHDAVDFVRNVVEPVHDLFKVVVNLVADDERHRIGAPLR